VQVDEGEQLTICGDVHGQFTDVIKIFEMNGMPSETNKYIFNGDFVDRGRMGTEILIVFMVASMLYPNSFFLNRGNHEIPQLNLQCGFMHELLTKYDLLIYNCFVELFKVLPVATVVNRDGGDGIFVVHGGLPAELRLDDINTKIDRHDACPLGLFGELLWNDPQDEDGTDVSCRGPVFHTFGPDVTRKFLETNNLKLLVRSHEMRPDGYSMEHNDQLCTLFSAPQSGVNLGAYLTVRGRKLEREFTTFTSAEQDKAAVGI